MKRVTLAAAAAVLVAVSFTGVSAPVLAAEQGLSIEPAQFEFRGVPGQTINESIIVRNRSTAPQTYFPGTIDIDSMDEDGRPVLAAQDGERSGGELSSWVTYAQPSVTLNPGESARVGFAIAVPANAPHGSHAGLIAFSTQPPEGNADDSFIAIAYATGALVSLRVGDDGGDAAQVLEFTTEERVSGTSAATFLTRIENTGTALVRPYGVITITDAFGRFTGSVSFNESGGALLPGSIRRFTTEWTGEGLMMGRYTAELVATYGDTQKGTLIADTAFWILPMRPLLIALAAGLLAFVLVYFWVRRTIRRSLRAAGVSSDAAPSGIWAAVVAALIIVALAVALAFLLL